MPDSVHLFWHNSNIFIPAQYVATRRDGGFAERNVRVHPHDFTKSLISHWG